MRLNRAYRIYSFTGGYYDGRPGLQTVNIVRLSAMEGAALASDGITLVAVPVVLAEDDVTGLVDGRMLRMATEAGQQPRDDEDADEEVDEFQRIAAAALYDDEVTIGLTPTHLVSDGIVFPRDGCGLKFPPVDTLMRLAQDGRIKPFNVWLNPALVGRVACVFPNGASWSQRKTDGPILVTALWGDEANPTYLGVRLPWALLMPMKRVAP